jgi:hypothetical protein
LPVKTSRLSRRHKRFGIEAHLLTAIDSAFAECLSIGQGFMYAILGMASLVFLVICGVHVIKTGRPTYWLWIILFFSLPGCLIYFFVEMLPELRRNSTAKRIGADLVNVVDPGRNLRKLQEQLEIADTVTNRQALARYYLRARQYEEAVALYQSCLEGVFADDPTLTFELSYALFLQGSYEEARQHLERLGSVDLGIRTADRNLLYARTLEQLGDVDASLVAYQATLPQSRGEETRCRYAALLEKAGRTAEAKEVYEDILKRAKRSPGYYRRTERDWIIKARLALDQLEQTP